MNRHPLRLLWALALCLALLPAAALAAEGGVPIDETHFPDAAFRDYVKAEFDGDGDGVLSLAEREGGRAINLSSQGVGDLTGIGAFPNLTTLDCSDNDLWALDLSANTDLTDLNCSNNNLTTLDLSANTALITLNCNYNNLTALDLSANTDLTDLDCSGNNLGALDCSANPDLAGLDCSFNISLTQLDLTANAALTYLNCNYTALTALDLTANPDLSTLYCAYGGLTHLNLSANSALVNLVCSYNKLATLDLSATSLYTVSCGNQRLVLTATQAGEAETLDLSAVIEGWDEVRNVTVTEGGRMADDGKTLLRDGSALIATVTYEIYTGYSSVYMDVTLTLYWTAFPELTGFKAVRTGASTADVTFTSGGAGTCYYIASDTEILISGESLVFFGQEQPVAAGTNTIFLSDLTASSQYVLLVVKDGVERISQPLQGTVPAYNPTVYAVTPDTGLVPVEPNRDEGRNAIQTASVAETDHGTVTLSPRRAAKGETVTVTATPDAGYVLSSLTLTDAGGNPLALTNEGDGTYTFTMPGSNVTVEARFRPVQTQTPEPEPEPLPFSDVEPEPLPFSDVAESAWYADAVAYVYEAGLMTGTGEGTFSPDAAASRSMVAAILWRMAGSPVVNYAMDFTDVPQGQWYSEAVRWAASEGVVTGCGDGTFGTDAPVTREQLAAMLYRFAQARGWDVTPSASLASYADAADVSAWAAPALEWASGAGILEGTGSGLHPQGQATRAELAAVLLRLSEGAAAR